MVVACSLLPPLPFVWLRVSTCAAKQLLVSLSYVEVCQSVPGRRAVAIACAGWKLDEY